MRISKRSRHHLRDDTYSSHRDPDTYTAVIVKVLLILVLLGICFGLFFSSKSSLSSSSSVVTQEGLSAAVQTNEGLGYPGPPPDDQPFVVLNFAQNCCQQAQAELAETIKQQGGVPRLLDLESAGDDLPTSVQQLVKSEKHGAGFWSWKPHIILAQMRRTREGGIVIYADTSVRFHQPLANLAKAAREHGFLASTVGSSLSASVTTKEDAVREVFPSEKAARAWRKTSGQKRQVLAAWLVLVNNAKNQAMIEEWAALTAKRELVDGLPSRAHREHPGLLLHTHDQALLSLVVDKYYPGCRRGDAGPLIPSATIRVHPVFGVATEKKARGHRNPRVIQRYADIGARVVAQKGINELKAGRAPGAALTYRSFVRD